MGAGTNFIRATYPNWAAIQALCCAIPEKLPELAPIQELPIQSWKHSNWGDGWFGQQPIGERHFYPNLGNSQLGQDTFTPIPASTFTPIPATSSIPQFGQYIFTPIRAIKSMPIWATNLLSANCGNSLLQQFRHSTFTAFTAIQFQCQFGEDTTFAIRSFCFIWLKQQIGKSYSQSPPWGSEPKLLISICSPLLT